MKILICGGRDYEDVPHLWRILDAVDKKRGPVMTVIDGASDDVTGPYVGADYWAHQWAIVNDRETIRFHAEWKTQGRSAGPIRNRRMRDEGKPDLVVAFPGGNGTRNMIELAKEAGIEVIQVR